MKIGIDARPAVLNRGTGIGTYTYQLIKNLHKLGTGHEFRYFWPGDEYRALDINHDEVFNNIQKHKDNYWEKVYISTCLEQEKIDIYHVPQNGIGIPTPKKSLLVVTIHDLIPYVSPGTTSKGYLKTFIKQMPRIVEQSDVIITVSEHSKRDLLNFFKLPEEKIKVIYEAPEPIYQPMEKDQARKSAADKYGLEHPYILYVGGFGPRKNIKSLVIAFAKICNDLPQKYQLVILGKKEKDYSDIIILAEALGLKNDIIFPGLAPVEDMPYLYNGSHLFVYPSFYEGFGLPPLEAMACGVPTITSNVSSIPEVVGNGAIKINPYNTIELAQAMFDVLTDPSLAEQLTERGLCRAGDFSWRKTAEETLKIYETLI